MFIVQIKEKITKHNTYNVPRAMPFVYQIPSPLKYEYKYIYVCGHEI